MQKSLKLQGNIYVESINYDCVDFWCKIVVVAPWQWDV